MAEGNDPVMAEVMNLLEAEPSSVPDSMITADCLVLTFQPSVNSLRWLLAVANTVLITIKHIDFSAEQPERQIAEQFSAFAE